MVFPILTKLNVTNQITNSARQFHTCLKSRQSDGFSHLNSCGQARMVDVGTKKASRRTARAEGRIYVGQEVLDSIEQQTMKKGDVLSVARLAAIMAAKQTANLIPLCHQIPLESVQVTIEACRSTGTLLVTSQVQTTHKTGVEIESLVSVSLALLTIYDMCKSLNRSDMIIFDIKLINKTK